MTEAIAKFEPRPIAAPNRSYSLAPQSFEDAVRFADLVCKSDLVPKDYKNNPGNVLVAVQMGAEIGLAPLQAIQNIAVINGRPSVWGDAALALCRASSLCEYVTEKVDNGLATCVAKRRGESEPIVRTFSEADAKRAGLWGKQGPWTQYPQRMLQLRARAFALRDAFPDVLRGLSVAEEVRDYVTPGQPANVSPLPAGPVEITVEPGIDWASRIAAADSDDELNAIRAEMKDAFGTVPADLVKTWKDRAKVVFASGAAA